MLLCDIVCHHVFVVLLSVIVSVACYWAVSCPMLFSCVRLCVLVTQYLSLFVSRVVYAFVRHCVFCVAFSVVHCGAVLCVVCTLGGSQ